MSKPTINITVNDITYPVNILNDEMEILAKQINNKRLELALLNKNLAMINAELDYLIQQFISSYINHKIS